ncbi:glycosyltransferase [Oscillatoria sp. CS-180]|uniref:glycosyltransferase n=1 Tax=Oscillatoria sp. CS-180 TaxID=3021720 RepID=UPI0023308F9C|nr:glycosyltransferase [Oscillatoria sp. CS-180]MDB9525058.1 glycosyltransferase [Oscillatoria sp. CS-180]
MPPSPSVKTVAGKTPLSSAYLVRRVHWATFILIAIVCLAAAIVAAWFAGQSQIATIFEQLARIQANPPFWAEVPMLTGQYLLAPTVILFLIAWGITRASPQPRTRSRIAVIAILLASLIRYLSWRIFSTLNLSDPLNGSFSLLLLSMEILGITGSVIQLLLLLRVRDRHAQADQLQTDVISGRYLPQVDVFIPTYDEPAFILRRTIIGCQAMDYPNKTIYLLDDTRRPVIKALAEDLGCKYLTRPDNTHAKAGNLNHAIAHTSGDLIASFDADFVPTRNFLWRTVGFFQDPNVALVQTPQSFYNPDPIARNLGLEGILTPDEEVFYRQIQPMRDGVGGVVCSGTSFVVRRTALEKTGGFVTESLSEDYFTAIRLAAQGNKVIYLNEKLSAGLAAETISAHATQRIRWAQGTLQAFFIETNPLTIRGLTLIQRLAHLEGLLHWFGSIPRIVFLLMPLAYTFFQVIPIQASPAEALYFFLPYYAVQLTVFGWLNHRSRSALLSDVYSLVLVFPLAATVIQALLKPFSKGFKVTPKGVNSDRFVFNWKLAWPLIIVFVLTAISLWRNLGWCLSMGWGGAHLKGMALGWIWSTYNLIMVGIALLILCDVPNPEGGVWLSLRRVVRLIVRQPGTGESMTVTSWWGVTESISETGAIVSLTQRGLPSLAQGEVFPVTLVIAEVSLSIPGRLIESHNQSEFPVAIVEFDPLPTEQQRQLIEMLFCRPGQWKRWNSPGELRSIWLVFKVLFRPRFLTGNVHVKPLPTSQG